MIFRDAYNVDRSVKALVDGKGTRDFLLSNDQILRLRVLHPEKPEHITGADLIYERHSKDSDEISIVLVQYKIWSDKTLYLNDKRMKDQLKKMRNFTCKQRMCKRSKEENSYRFPCCAAFLRPTDKLQAPNQKLISTGEHIPLCKIKKYSETTARKAKVLRYESMRDVSLSSDMFEYLFNRGKIGSRYLSFAEVEAAYKESMVITGDDRVVVYAQDFHVEEE